MTLTAWEKILYVFFPRRCDCCGCVVHMYEAVCPKCLDALPDTAIKEACFKCANGFDFCLCGRKRKKYNGVTAPFYYEGPAENAIHRLKFAQKPETAKTLAKYMANRVKELYEWEKFDIISFIPAGETSQKDKEFNSAELLAKELALLLDIQCLSLLAKVIDTPPQKNLTAEERKANLFGAFDVTEEIPLADKCILLCDDVVTTGATFEECSYMLKLYGAKEVYCAAAAAAKKEFIEKV